MRKEAAAAATTGRKTTTKEEKQQQQQQDESINNNNKLSREGKPTAGYNCHLTTRIPSRVPHAAVARIEIE